jgi:hypothetical protein
MSILGLVLLIVVLCVIRQYLVMPEPVPMILTIVVIILAVVLLIVVLQSLGVVPGFWGRPVVIQ